MVHEATSFLGQIVTVAFDRPAGSRHPTHGFLYPINYGFLPGVPAPDGDFLDAYLLHITAPLADFTGTGLAVIHRLDDNDDKLVVVPTGQTASDAQIREQTAFQEQFYNSVIIR